MDVDALYKKGIAYDVFKLSDYIKLRVHTWMENRENLQLSSIVQTCQGFVRGKRTSSFFINRGIFKGFFLVNK